MTRAHTASKKVHAPSRRKRSRNHVAPRNATVEAARQAGQGNLIPVHAYASANAAWDMVPARMPTDASAAKWTPGSRARKKAIGPDVSGIPTSQPLTAAPHRRPARLATPTSAGVTRSLRRNAST